MCYIYNRFITLFLAFIKGIFFRIEYGNQMFCTPKLCYLLASSLQGEIRLGE